MSRCVEIASACALLLSSAETTVPDWPSAAKVGPKIDRLFKAYDRPNGPGCAVGVYNAGQILFAKGYGKADLQTKRPITPSSVFNIASLTKQFTAFAIALLESEGKVSLDAPVRQYVPELPDFGSAITVRHLVHHISGLRDFGSLMELTGWRLDQEFFRGELLKLLARQRELNFAPGTSHEYGNTNYVLLGMIIERASGQSYGDFLAERIFRPLGMANSAFGEPVGGSENLARNYAPGERGFFINHVWAKAYAPGVVNVHSSIEDLARWDANFFRPLVGDRGLIERLYSPARLTTGEPSNYGFGLFTGTHQGFRTVAHSGLGGGSFYLLRFPEQRLSVATLCNQYGVGPQAPDTHSLSHAVADLFLPEAEGDLHARKQQDLAPAITLSSAELGSFAGDYWVADEGAPISLRMTAIGLAELYGGKFYPMVAVGPSSFRDEGGNATYSFSGPNRSVLTYEEASANYLRRAERRPAWSPTAHELQAVSGRYCSSEVDVCWSLEQDGEKLWLVRPGFPRTVLKPAFADTFRVVDSHWIGARNLRITLQRDKRVEINGFRVSRGRVRNLLFERTR